jgi:WNK lysine deficient protein kinase
MWFRYFGVDKCNFVLLNSIRILRFEEAYNDEQSFALVDDMTLQAPFLGQG